MSFVGILCTPKQETYIKQILQQYVPLGNLIILKEENMENFKNITFETVAIFSNQGSLFHKVEILEKIMEKAKYVIMNADEPIVLKPHTNVNGNVITYGFNTKSTITASSVKEDRILLCIQRGFQNRYAQMLEPQEILVPLQGHKMNTSVLMGLETIHLIYEKRKEN